MADEREYHKYAFQKLGRYNICGECGIPIKPDEICFIKDTIIEYAFDYTRTSKFFHIECFRKILKKQLENYEKELEKVNKL